MSNDPTPEELEQILTDPVLTRKLLFTFSLPTVVGMIVVSLYNLVDTIFVGKGVGPLAKLFVPESGADTDRRFLRSR